MIHYSCPHESCDNRVGINIPDYPDGPGTMARVEVWCATRHHRPVRMVIEADAVATSAVPTNSQVRDSQP